MSHVAKLRVMKSLACHCTVWLAISNKSIALAIIVYRQRKKLAPYLFNTTTQINNSFFCFPFNTPTHYSDYARFIRFVWKWGNKSLDKLNARLAYSKHVDL